MVRTQIINLQELVKFIAQAKGITASSQDGNVVGIDSVSGDNYFATMPSVGTIYKGADGQTRIIVDAIAYPAHVGEKGNSYKSELRFISVAFNVNTLDIIKDSRRNIGYDAITKRDIISLTPFTYVEDRMAKAVQAKADAERQARIQAKADADARAKKAKEAEMARNAQVKSDALKRLAKM